MEVWNLLSTILRSFGLNLSDMDHFRGNFMFLQLVANRLYESLYNLVPVPSQSYNLFVGHAGHSRGAERHLIFPVCFLHPPGALTKSSSTESSQSSTRGAGFTDFPRI